MKNLFGFITLILLLAADVYYTYDYIFYNGYTYIKPYVSLPVLILINLGIACALTCGTFASSRKIGFWGGFLVSVFFSPLIGLLMIGLSEKK